MVDKQAIYHKTSKGMEAIANRHSGLVPKLRSLLIMIDGKRNHAELATLSSVLGDCEVLMSQLADHGLIESVPGAVPAAPADPNTAPAPLTVATLSEAKRFTSHLLMDTLGPTSDVLCIKIEAAHNLAEFVSAVKRARDTLRDIKGTQAAQRFIEQVEQHTPQA